MERTLAFSLDEMADYAADYGQCGVSDKEIVLPLADFPTRKIAAHAAKYADMPDTVLPCGATCLCLG
jgi:hypothetical protein